jgi:glycosyltransferase involved in cell wall biosynthesis
MGNDFCNKMTLSIITINYNDAEGLRKTLASVAAQTYANIEHIIVDGGSTDGAVEIIREYADDLVKGEKLEVKGVENGGADNENNSTPIYTTLHNSTPPKHHVRWVSEKDTGIYNAMNKGIEIALGRREVRVDHTSAPLASNLSPLASNHYIQILNSGDLLASADVTERMMAALLKVKGYRLEVKGNENGEADTPASRLSPLASRLKNCPAIFYGNMTKVNAAGQIVGKSGYTEYSLRQFYSSTLNHDCAYIRADLFEEYGLYDENLKIVSDWKWYLQAIGLGRAKPEYVDIDVTIFDDGGISETNLALRNAERRQVLEELLPPAVLWDYDQHAFEMEQMNRLRKWKLYPLVYFMERVCFKLEKWFCKR